MPESIRVVGALLPGGWPAVMRRNHALTLATRRLLCDALNVLPPCPDEMIGSLAVVPLPDMDATARISNIVGLDSLRGRLLREHGIEVPVFPWPAPPKRLLRISAQLYNSLPQYEKLAAVLQKIFPLRKSK